MLFESPSDLQLQPGSWSLWKIRRRVLLFCCPRCKKLKIIRQDVLQNGRVAGAVRCITSSCSFHEQVHLVGWKRGEVYP